MMLPFLEQNALSNTINIMLISDGGGGSGQEANWTGTTSRVNAFLCPSSPLPTAAPQSKPVNNGLLVGNNYFGSVGPSLQCIIRDYGSPAGRSIGVFGTIDPSNPGAAMISLAAIRDGTGRDGTGRDGTSNTIAFGEWRTGDGNINQLSIQDVIQPNQGPPGINIWWEALTQMPTGQAGFLAWLPICAGAARGTLGTPNNKSFIGDNWYDGEFGDGLGNTLLPPNSKYPNCTAAQGYTGAAIGDAPGIYGMSSFHPGGAVVAVVDGSVRFLKDTTNMYTVWSLGTAAGGEVVSADSY